MKNEENDMRCLIIIVFLIIITVTAAKAGDCDVFQFNQCISCDASYAFKVAHTDDCQRYCPNRKVGDYFLDKVTRCILISCPQSKPYRSKTGSCYISLAEAEADLDDEKENTNNDDIEKEALSAVYGKCPENKPLQRWDGRCFSCDEEKAIRLPTHCNTKHDCEGWCPNRTILYSIGGNIPSIPNCPPDKPLMDSVGICHSCNEVEDILLNYNEKLCQKSCPTQRYLYGNVCKLKNKLK